MTIPNADPGPADTQTSDAKDSEIPKTDHQGAARNNGAPKKVMFPPPAAPLPVARKLFKEFRIPTGKTLVAWRGTWMKWRTTHWEEIGADELRAHIYRVLGNAEYEAEVKVGGVITVEIRNWNPDKRKVANVIEAMQAVGHTNSNTDTPAWIGPHNADGIAATEVISCTNGLLDLSTRTLLPHTPALFNEVAVPFDYAPAAATPTAWLEFLAALWPDDSESIALLQEYVGYALSGRTDMQKMLLLIGPSRSGKGTIARMLTELIGRLHVAGPTLASLGTNFGLSPLMGKPLAIISDARLGDQPSHVVVERLLSITGEDMLTVDRKFRDPWSGKLPTRFVILSNELPKFRDSSGAIANRMLILQMTNSFLGREDRTLDARLKAELPGILLWALEGLDRLVENGRFTVPRSSDDATTLMMDLASPMSAFVRDRCIRRPDAKILVDDLFAAWKDWAEDNGHIGGSKSVFGRNLKSAVPGLRNSEPRGTNGVRLKYYLGIGAKSDYPDPDADSEPDPKPENDGPSVCNGFSPAPPAPRTTTDRPDGAGAGSSHANGNGKPHVNDGGAGGAGKSPLSAQHQQKKGAGAGSGAATSHARNGFNTDPPCFHCDKPVIGKFQDDQGRYAHKTCTAGAR